MADEKNDQIQNDASASAATVTPDRPKFKSAGAVQPLNTTTHQSTEGAATAQTSDNPASTTSTPTPQAAEGAAAAQGTEGAQAASPATATALPPDEHQLALLKKLFGDDFSGTLDEAKERIAKANTPAPAEPTAEEKAERERAFENRMLDFYRQNGGTAEDFVAMKQVASADLTELSEKQLVKELKDAKFTDEQIEAIKQERYYQLADEDLEKFADETEKEFVKRKKEFFTNKLKNRAAHVQNSAIETLNSIRTQVETLDLLEQKDREFASKVDAHVQSLPRKITFDLGKADDVAIAPIEFEVTEESIQDVAETLKDKGKRNQLFFNPDNSLNISNIANLILRNKYLESALKKTYLVGSDRQVEAFKKTFPSDPYTVGVGGADPRTKGGKAGRFVKAGGVQYVGNKSN